MHARPWMLEKRERPYTGFRKLKRGYIEFGVVCIHSAMHSAIVNAAASFC